MRHPAARKPPAVGLIAGVVVALCCGGPAALALLAGTGLAVAAAANVPLVGAVVLLAASVTAVWIRRRSVGQLSAQIGDDA